MRTSCACCLRASRRGPATAQQRAALDAARARRRQAASRPGDARPGAGRAAAGVSSAAAAKSALTAAPACRACSRMNYRHAYHAGNFADVLKHAVLALVIEYLKRKEAPFRVDRHACGRRPLCARLGRGRQDRRMARRHRAASSGPTPRRCRPTWRAASAALPRCRAPGECAAAALALYPGSPAIALGLMRPQDVLIANELHPEDRAALKAAIGRDRRAKVMALDAWVALKALLPPKERRGVVLIDPPFEETDELERMADGLAQGSAAVRHRRLSRLVPDQGPETRSPASMRVWPSWGRCRLMRVELMIQRPSRPRAPQRLRARHRQSALHVGGRYGSSAARSQPPADRCRRRRGLPPRLDRTPRNQKHRGRPPGPKRPYAVEPVTSKR